MSRTRQTAPKGALRPFQPGGDDKDTATTEQRLVEALEHIAVSLSAIDHNLEKLLALMRRKP